MEKSSLSLSVEIENIWTHGMELGLELFCFMQIRIESRAISADNKLFGLAQIERRVDDKKGRSFDFSGDKQNIKGLENSL